MIGWQRLDIETRRGRTGDLLLPQRRGASPLRRCGSARGVDDIGRRLHQPEFPWGRRCRAERWDRTTWMVMEIGLPEQVFLAHIVDAGLLALLRRQVFWLQAMTSSQRLGDPGGAVPSLPSPRARPGVSRRGRPRSSIARHPRLHACVLVCRCAGELEHQADGDAGGRIADGRGAQTTTRASLAAAPSIEAMRMPW